MPKAPRRIVDVQEDSHFKDSSCKELWGALKFVAPKRDITYFLIIDSLDQISDGYDAEQQLLGILAPLQHSLPESNRSRIQVLASAKPITFGQDAFQNVPAIDVEQHNGAEIRDYIYHELQKRDLLLGRDAETVKLRDLINKKLPGIAQGNFFRVQTALGKIEEAVAADGSSTEEVLDLTLSQLKYCKSCFTN